MPGRTRVSPDVGPSSWAAPVFIQGNKGLMVRMSCVCPCAWDWSSGHQQGGDGAAGVTLDEEVCPSPSRGPAGLHLKCLSRRVADETCSSGRLLFWHKPRCLMHLLPDTLQVSSHHVNKTH